MDFLIILIALPCVSASASCKLMHYCKTDEVKYVSMNKITKMYLNATAIEKHIVSSLTECQKMCVRADRCASLNLKITGKKAFECQILDANIYSNSSLIASDDASTHLFIPVSISISCIGHSNLGIALWL